VVILWKSQKGTTASLQQSVWVGGRSDGLLCIDGSRMNCLVSCAPLWCGPEQLHNTALITSDKLMSPTC